MSAGVRTATIRGTCTRSKDKSEHVAGEAATLENLCIQSFAIVCLSTAIFLLRR